MIRGKDVVKRVTGDLAKSSRGWLLGLSVGDFLQRRNDAATFMGRRSFTSRDLRASETIFPGIGLSVVVEPTGATSLP